MNPTLLERQVLAMAAGTATKILERGHAQNERARIVQLAAAWQLGLELGLEIGTIDVATARWIREQIARWVGHDELVREAVREAAGVLLGVAAGEMFLADT